MKKISALLVLILMFLLISYVHAQSPQQTLAQYLSDLQKNPNDNALREKIIRHVQTMTPKPAIPEEAERYMARGGAAVKAAKNEKDFQDAALEFEKASLVAPWLPAAYYNLGITQDKAGKYKEAIQSLKLYLLAAPEASDAKAVKTLVYEIEYRQEKAAQVVTASKENVPAKVQEKSRKDLSDLVGTWGWDQRYMRAEMRGKELWFMYVGDNNPAFIAFNLEGRELRVAVTWNTRLTARVTVSEDFNVIKYQERWPNGETSDIILKKQ